MPRPTVIVPESSSQPAPSRAPGEPMRFASVVAGGLTPGPEPAMRDRLYADILADDETPAQVNEAVRQWREGSDG